MNIRNLYHYDGMTSLPRMREEAQRHADEGQEVILHLHAYEEEFDGCMFGPDIFTSSHEFFSSPAP